MPKKAKTRAANGMGSVRQRPDGRWEGRYTAPDGKQRSVYGRSEAEATRKLRTALHDLDDGHWMEPSRMTVGEWLQIWLADYVTGVTPRTIDFYARVVRLHISPVIGSVKLTSLSALHVRKVMTEMAAKRLSPTYVNEARGVLSIALNAAVQEARLIKTNPAATVRGVKRAKKAFTIIDRQMYPAFIAAANETPQPRAIILMLMTGLRLREMCGLQWADVDLDKATMRISHQLVQHSQPKLEPPKDGSARDLHLTPEAVSLLREQQHAQKVDRMSAGADWQEDSITSDLVFRSPLGAALSGSTIYKYVRSIGAKMGLPSLHPHDLRHSYAVAALRAGLDVKTVQHNLGHRSAAMTLDTYAAYTSDAGKVGAEKLSGYWQEAMKNG